MSTDRDIIVTDQPDKNRYIVEVDGQRAGMAVYYDRGNRHLFVHTEVDDAYAGEGVGSALVRGALDDVREKGGSVVALCPFVKRWIDEHDDYASLVDEELDTLLRP